MIQKVDLNKNNNLFVVSVILIAGVGGLAVDFNTANGKITITEVACALILGILTNLMMKGSKEDDEVEAVAAPAEAPAEEKKAEEQ